MDKREEATDMESKSSQYDSEEFGLEDIASLPLLERVHRLCHAITQGYPYKQTKGWKSLSLAQKKEMLAYIQKTKAPTPTPPNPSTCAEKSTPSVQERALRDPYLTMLRRKKEKLEASLVQQRSQGDTLSEHYAFPPRSPAKPITPRWQMLESKFYQCHCGKTHGKLSNEPKNVLVKAIMLMFTTFGDTDLPCIDAANKAKSIVGEKLRKILDGCKWKKEGNITLKELLQHFPEESAYFARWKELRKNSKAPDESVDSDEDFEDLEEELEDVLSESDQRSFGRRFKERLKFADIRTTSMSMDIYESFSEGRKANFVGARKNHFCEWLKIPRDTKKTAMEFLNFVAYDSIGALVEGSIRLKTQGKLTAQTKPLTPDDINAAAKDSLNLSLSASMEEDADVEGDRDGHVQSNADGKKRSIDEMNKEFVSSIEFSKARVVELPDSGKKVLRLHRLR